MRYLKTNRRNYILYPAFLSTFYIKMNTGLCTKKYLSFFIKAPACIALLFFYSINTRAQPKKDVPVNKVASDFTVLLKRPLAGFKPSLTSFATDSVLIEKGFIYSEENEKVPLLIYKPLTGEAKPLPVVICLHGTGGNKEQLKDFLYRLTKKGIMAVAIDARYHGERISGGAHGAKEYVAAITKAFENTDTNKQEHPFFYDTVYDLWRLTDYLETRPDVNAKRIGMFGISMGGIEAWLAASVDKRIKVTVPAIAVQSFKWSLENDRWQGRANTIWAVHQQAAKDAGDSVVNKRSVAVVWNKLIPGITGEFDCPSMIRLFAPRPLLILNTEKDPNCPLPGARVAFEAATKSYKADNALDKLKIHITPNEGHTVTPADTQLAIDWFYKWL